MYRPSIELSDLRKIERRAELPSNMKYIKIEGGGKMHYKVCKYGKRIYRKVDMPISKYFNTVKGRYSNNGIQY